MNNRSGYTAIIASIIAVIISIVAIVTVMNRPLPASEPESAKDVQYVLYLGTNDKDTNEPVYSSEEAQEKLKQILLDHFGGYTIQEAHGGWKDEDKVYNEYTLVVYLSDSDIDSVHAAAKKMIDEFHQSSVLIQANKTTTEFYDGSN